MTEYKVMAKGRRDRRFHTYGHHTESAKADKNATSLANSLWTSEVIVIVNDGYVKERLTYK